MFRLEISCLFDVDIWSLVYILLHSLECVCLYFCSTMETEFQLAFYLLFTPIEGYEFSGVTLVVNFNFLHLINDFNHKIFCYS